MENSVKKRLIQRLFVGQLIISVYSIALYLLFFEPALDEICFFRITENFEAFSF